MMPSVAGDKSNHPQQEQKHEERNGKYNQETAALQLLLALSGFAFHGKLRSEAGPHLTANSWRRKHEGPSTVAKGFRFLSLELEATRPWPPFPASIPTDHTT
jgi:hypothetical protein